MQRFSTSTAVALSQPAFVGDARVDLAAESDPFGLQEILRLLQRRMRLIGFLFATVALLGAAFVLLQPPRYEATALLQVGPAPQSGADRTSIMPGPDFVQSQVELLRSRATLGRLVDTLHHVSPNKSVADLSRTLEHAIDVHRQDQSFIIQVTATAENPAQAAQYANGLVTAYLNLREQAAQNRANALRHDLAQGLTAMQTEVQQRDQAVIDYRKQHGLQFVSDENELSPQLGAMRASLGQARGDLADLDARAAEGADGRLSGGQSEALAQLRAREADIGQREADLSHRYGDQHPALQAVRAELAGIRGQIAAENARQSTSLGVAARAAHARYSALESSIAAVNGQALGNSAEAAALRQLQRVALVSRSVFEDQLRRFNELGVSGAPEAGDVQLVANASDTPTQAPRHRAGALALVMALAGVIALLTAYLLQQFDRRLTSSDDVPRLLGLPLLACIPKLSTRDLRGLPPQNAQPVGFLAENPGSRFAEALRVLWVNLSHGPREQRPRVIAVTSAISGEGKTSTALCLARTVVSTQCSVILVDCDLRRRSLNHYLGIEPTSGVVDVLSGRCGLDQAIGRDAISGADILPATAEDGGASDIFSTAAMHDLLRQLSERYDLVILDSAPVLSFAEGRTLAALADGALIVARSGRSDGMASRAAATQLESVGANILGVVFNAVSAKSNGRRAYSDSLYFDYARKNAYSS